MTYLGAVALAAVFFVLTAILPAATQTLEMGIVPSTDSLKALYPGQYKQAFRMGFASQGDSPPLSYNWVSTNCDRPDNGAEVQPATGTGCWRAVFQGTPDARQWGLALTNTPRGNLAALNAALAYAATYNGCIAVPQPATPYQLSGSLTITGSRQIGGCLRGIRGAGYSAWPSAGCQLQFTDATGIIVNRRGTRLEDLSWCGNAATSTSPALTAGLSITAAGEGTLRNLYIQNFVVCRQIVGAYGRSYEDNIHCADQQLYPNLVNRFPLACVMSTHGRSGSWAASRVDNDECREQAWAGRNIYFTGDGVTTAFDVGMPPGGIPLWAADGIKPKVGNFTVLPNGYVLKDAPRKICGLDYTLWDISAGGGGTQVYCARKTIQTVQGNAVATITAGGAGDIPPAANPPNIQVVSTHGLDLYPRIAAVNTGASQITMTGPATVSESLTVELVQLDIKHDGCGAATCGTKMEVRFATPPASGIRVNPQWNDPTGQVVYDIESGSDHLTINPVHIGGYRTALRWIGKAYGGVRLSPAYFEDINQIADIESRSYGITLEFNNIIDWHASGAYAAAYGGNVAPWYVSPHAGPVTIHWNNRGWLYNGATAGGEWAGYVSGKWYSPGPPGTSYNTTGAVLTTPDRAECSPIVFGGRFRLSRMAVNVTAAGSGAALKVGLYENDPLTNRPGMLLSAGNVTISGTGDQTGPMSDYIGSPGHYWECYVATWTAAPSAITFQALLGGGSPGNWLLGSSFPGTLYNTNQAQSVVYQAAGLYAAGLPQYLSGLTTDASGLRAAAVSWQQM